MGKFLFGFIMGVAGLFAFSSWSVWRCLGMGKLEYEVLDNGDQVLTLHADRDPLAF